MFTAENDKIEAHANERVQITYNVTDAEGNPVDCTTATGSFKIGREMGSTTLLTKSSSPGLVFSGTQAIATFNTNEVQEKGAQALGNFFAQLRISIGGIDLVSAKGRVIIQAVLA